MVFECFVKVFEKWLITPTKHVLTFDAVYDLEFGLLWILVQRLHKDF